MMSRRKKINIKNKRNECKFTKRRQVNSLQQKSKIASMVHTPSCYCKKKGGTDQDIQYMEE